MGMINHKEILKRMGKDIPYKERFIIEPFFNNLKNDNTAAPSIDFHLGNRFTIFKKRKEVIHDPDSLTESKDVTTSEFFVSFGDHFILHPGQLVLGTTLEWYCFPFDIMAHVIGRSIWGRRGLIIATATAVQPGSSGTITLELCNNGELAIVLQPGSCIGQLFCQKVGPGMQGKDSTSFSGTLRPAIGNYKNSNIENFLKKQDKNI